MKRLIYLQGARCPDAGVIYILRVSLGIQKDLLEQDPKSPLLRCVSFMESESGCFSLVAMLFGQAHWVSCCQCPVPTPGETHYFIMTVDYDVLTKHGVVTSQARQRRIRPVHAHTMLLNWIPKVATISYPCLRVEGSSGFFAQKPETHFCVFPGLGLKSPIHCDSK